MLVRLATSVEMNVTDLSLQRTALYQSHIKSRAKMVPFAGYAMPVQYPSGVMAEHLWTREHAGVFDVAHMGQAAVTGGTFAEIAAAMEKLVPASVTSLKVYQQRYSQLLNDEGGILDDLMMTRLPDEGEEGRLYLVVNGARKAFDFTHISSHLPPQRKLEIWADAALIALQGPEAETVLEGIVPGTAKLAFMQAGLFTWKDLPLHISRSGYSGEDGFEISVEASAAPSFWDEVLKTESVKPIGLAARDSLRLEAGLCLYGHDIDETTSPIEAGLLWSIQKQRREAGGFLGAARVLAEVASGPPRKRVGLIPEGRLIAREGTVITDDAGQPIGTVTSGGFGPSINGPIAMGYVSSKFPATETQVQLLVRGKAHPARIVPLPFHPHNFKR